MGHHLCTAKKSHQKEPLHILLAPPWHLRRGAQETYPPFPKHESRTGLAARHVSTIAGLCAAVARCSHPCCIFDRRWGAGKSGQLCKTCAVASKRVCQLVFERNQNSMCLGMPLIERNCAGNAVQCLPASSAVLMPCTHFEIFSGAGLHLSIAQRK